MASSYSLEVSRLPAYAAINLGLPTDIVGAKIEADMIKETFSEPSLTGIYSLFCHLLLDWTSHY